MEDTRNYTHFTVTDDHLKLLGKAWFNYYDEGDFGAAGMDQKRPYGNSNVYSDIGEILGVEPAMIDSWGDPAFSDEQQDYFLKIHKGLTEVLNIMVSVGTVTPGRYRTEQYRNRWELIV